MTDTRKAGLALLFGTLGALLTMALHPVAPTAQLTPTQLQHLAVASAVAHSIAIASFIATFLGAAGLTRHLTPSSPSPTRLPSAALAFYAFACVAILIATAVSGFILPTLLRHMAHDGPAYLATWHIVLDAIFQFNQAFARIYTVLVSAAILLWSVSALRTAALPRAVSLYGIVAPVILILLIAIGHLHLDVHGMLAVVIAHTLWFLPASIHLLRPPA